MPSQSDITPQVPDGATPTQCIAMWLDLLNASEQFLLAGLRREIGPDGDLKAAYREWYRKEMEEHDKMMFHMMEEFSKREGTYGG